MEINSLNLKKKSLSVLELKRLLVELQELRPDICVRYRLLGEMWRQNFVRIVSVVENGVFFEDEDSKQLINISNLNHIIQFEIDHNFQNYEAHFHYEVVLDRE